MNLSLCGRVAQEYITITGRTMPYGTAYQYDAADRLTRMGYPNGEWVTTTYDAGGQPYSLLGWSAYVVSATYNALGQPARTRFGNGLEARYWYFGLNTYPSWGNTAWGRLRRACVVTQTASGSCGDASPAPIFDLAYWYDLGGNIAYLDDVQNGGQRQYFGYDGLSRLVSAWTTAAGNGQYNETYAYNAIGNFTSKAGVTQWYSDTAHAHAVTHLNGERRAWYDANGNMTQRVEMSGSQRITYTQEWDVENKLVAVTNTVAGQVTRFYRDADGALVKKSDGAGTVMIVGTHFEHITATNQSTSYYVFGSQRVAMRVAGAVYWLHGDHLGSASLTTNASGQKVAELRYLPFGETRWAWGTTPTDRRYTGQRELPAIGLYDYNARMYWPAAGRFVSADTVVPGPGNPQAFNRYMYVLGNPLRFTDPTGHMTDEELAEYLGFASLQAWQQSALYQEWSGNAAWWKMIHDERFTFGAVVAGRLGEQGEAQYAMVVEFFHPQAERTRVGLAKFGDQGGEGWTWLNELYASYDRWELFAPADPTQLKNYYRVGYDKGLIARDLRELPANWDVQPNGVRVGERLKLKPAGEAFAQIGKDAAIGAGGGCLGGLVASVFFGGAGCIPAAVTGAVGLVARNSIFQPGLVERIVPALCINCGENRRPLW